MRKKLVTAGLAAALILSLGFMAQAQQVDLKAALEQTGLVDDGKKIGAWFNNELGKHLGFYAGSGGLTPGNPLGGLPHFEIGIGGGVDLAAIDIGPFPKSADLALIQDLPIGDLPFSDIPLPLPLWALHADIGIFPGIDVAIVKMLSIDVGGKFGFLPNLDFGTGEVGSTLYGGEVRIGILQDNLAIPGLSLTLGYEGVTGGFTLTQKDFIKDNQVNLPVPGTTATLSGTINGDITIENTYNANVFSGKILLSKNLLFILPYGGVGFQLNSGNVSTTIKPSVTFQDTNSQNLTFTQGQKITLEAKDTKDIGVIRPTDIRLIAGMELRILILGIGIEWNATPEFSDNFVGLGLRLNI